MYNETNWLAKHLRCGCYVVHVVEEQPVVLRFVGWEDGLCLQGSLSDFLICRIWWYICWSALSVWERIQCNGSLIQVVLQGSGLNVKAIFLLYCNALTAWCSWVEGNRWENRGEFSVFWASILVACSIIKPNSPSVFLLLGFWEIWGFREV